MKKQISITLAAIMLAGVALLSLQGEGGVNIGDFLTFLCGILYAVHICVVDAFADQDVMQLTCLQFTFAALFWNRRLFSGVASRTV